jgi:hypothetical protein
MLVAGMLAACTIIPAEPSAQTMLLGQVSYIAGYDEAIGGKLRYVSDPELVLKGASTGEEHVPPAKGLMSACNLNEATDKRFARVRLFYLFPRPKSRPTWREVAIWTMIDTEAPIDKGNIVEVELRAGPGDSRCAAVEKIWAKNLAANFSVYLYATAQPHQEEVAYFYSRALEADGWQQMAGPHSWLYGAGPVGYYDGYFWYKPPPPQTQ